MVGDLGRRRHRAPVRSRTASPRYRDRRRDPLDRVAIGLVQPIEELTRVRRKTLDIAPLALRVERIEGQRRLSASRQPTDHDELATGNVDVDVLQIVDATTANRDGPVVQLRSVGAEVETDDRWDRNRESTGGDNA